MAGRREFIFELAKKLDVLRRATDKQTWSEVQDMSGISKAALENARNREHKAYSRLGVDHQRQLASAFRFPLGMPEWRPDDRLEADYGPGPDTAKAFAVAFRKLRADQASVDAATSGSEAAIIGTKSNTIHDAPAELVRSKGTALGPVRTPLPDPLTKDLRLASIAIQGTQGTSSSILVSFTIGCAEWGGCAVQRGRIEMQPHPGWVGQDAAGKWALPVEVKMVGHKGPGKVVIVRGFSTPFDPFWEVGGVDMPIGSFTTEGDFALVEGVSAGDKITVTFGTWLGDIGELDETPGIVPAASEADIEGFSPVNVRGDEERVVDLNGFKRRLIDDVRKSGLSLGHNGYLKLCSCTLELVETQGKRQR